MSKRSKARPFPEQMSVSSVFVATLIFLTLVVSAPANATGEKADKGIPDSLQPCITQALASKAQQWLCSPDGLEVQVDVNGKARTNRQSGIENSAPSAAPGSDRNPQRLGTASTQEPVLMAGGDDYDTWCETGTICRRKINGYISETKGNAAYGNQNGVIGSYDIVLRTNLNGRQANSSLAFIWDSGPSLSFYNTGIRCMEYPTTFTPALNCGWHDVSPMWVGLTKYRADSGLIYGNRLNNSNVYVNFAHTYFTPTGYSPYVAAQLESLDFNCWGTGNCYFP